MIQSLHYLKDSKLWEFMVYSLLIWGHAGFISSTLGSQKASKGIKVTLLSPSVLRVLEAEDPT